MTKPGFEDFAAFVQAIGFKIPRGDTLIGPVNHDGTSLYVGWAQDKPEVKGAYLDSLRNYAQAQEIWCEGVRAWCDEQSSKLKAAAE
jgi:hypothetical protein